METVSGQRRQNVMGEGKRGQPSKGPRCSRVSVVKSGLTSGVERSELNLMRAKYKEGREEDMTEI